MDQVAIARRQVKIFIGIAVLLHKYPKGLDLPCFQLTNDQRTRINRTKENSLRRNLQNKSAANPAYQVIENLTIHSKLDKTEELVDQIQEQLQDIYDNLLSELNLSIPIHNIE